MLLGLTIRDIVLIDRLTLVFRPGLCVLTGETGAGKSILLDALGLALGKRADASLVRPGAEQAAIIAEFAVADNHPALTILRAAGVGTDLAGTIVLRRLVAADGRSRAFVNDEPASVGLLRELGDASSRSRARASSAACWTRRRIACCSTRSPNTRSAPMPSPRPGASGAWRASVPPRRRGFWPKAAPRRTCCGTITPRSKRWRPRATRRNGSAPAARLLQSAERLGEAVAEAIAEIDGEDGAQQALARGAAPARPRPRPGAGTPRQRAGGGRARRRGNRRGAGRADRARALELDPRALEEVEERLFALRALARKHMSRSPTCRGCAREWRPARRDRDRRRRGRRLEEAAAGRARYIEAAGAVSGGRERAARRLDARSRRS